MYNSNLKSLHSIQHVYSEGQEVWFSCLIPKFDWFEKILSIDEILEPIKVKITNHKLIPDPITQDDKIIIKKSGLGDVVRKFNLSVYLDIDYIVKIKVFEQRNKEIGIVIPHTHIISHHEDEVYNAFNHLVIQTKADIDFDSETTFKKDENYQIFKKAYEKASNEFPEEVIKAHDRYKNNV
jgi:hypothetical protein